MSNKAFSAYRTIYKEARDMYSAQNQGPMIIATAQSTPTFDALATPGNTLTGQPRFYSPLHTPSNWQIPQKRQEVYVWARFFGTMEPKVAAALDFYSQFPTCTGFDNVCEDDRIKEYYDDIARRLNLDDLLPIIAYEYFAMGDVFPFASIYCTSCGGSGFKTTENGELVSCNHEGGTIGAVTVLNPDYIEVRRTAQVNDETIFMIPDENLVNTVRRREPREVYDRIPDPFKMQILAGMPIRLHPQSISHLAHNRTGYMPYGRSIVYRLFQTLAYKDKIRQAQWSVADRHILPIRVVKVGSDTFPAGDGDIAAITQQVLSAVNDPNFTLVTHHALDYDFVGSTGKVLQLKNEYDLVTEELLDGLMINKALLNSEGPSYSNASIGIEAMIRRLSDIRRKLQKWIEEKIYRPIAIMQGFYKKNESGQLVPFYPEVKWKRLNIRDDSNEKSFILQLYDKGAISEQTLLEFFDFDYSTELDRKRMENVIKQEYGLGSDEEDGGFGGGGSFGGGGFGGGGGLGGDKGGGLEGDNQSGGAFDFGNHGQSGPDSGTPARDLGSTAPESMPKSSYELVQDSLPTKYQLPKYRKPGGKFDQFFSILQSQKDKQIKQVNKLKEQQAKMQQKMLEAEQGPQKTKMSQPEWILFKGLREAQGQKKIQDNFTIQLPIPNTRLLIDFAFPQKKLAIEVDSGSFHTMEEQVKNDAKKDNILTQNGWTLLRFSTRQIEEALEDMVMPLILKSLKDKGNNELKEGLHLINEIKYANEEIVNNSYNNLLKKNSEEITLNIK